jgi:hypothetical protein
MSVFNGRGSRVDVLAISQEMRQAVRLWETVYVIVLDPGVNDAYFTGKNSAAFKWHGFARYQPYRKDIPIAQVTNPTTTATARFQIDFDADGAIPDIKTNYRVLIIPASQANEILPADGQINEYPDPFITQYVHVVTSAMNSSQAWIRTIETIVDTRTRENFAIRSKADDTGFEWIP